MEELDKFREFKAFLEEMSEEMKERSQKNLISAHYGIKEPEFKRPHDRLGVNSYHGW